MHQIIDDEAELKSVAPWPNGHANTASGEALGRIVIPMTPQMTYAEAAAYYREKARYYRQLAETTVQPRCAELSKELAACYQKVAASTGKLEERSPPYGQRGASPSDAGRCMSG